MQPAADTSLGGPWPPRSPGAFAWARPGAPGGPRAALGAGGAEREGLESGRFDRGQENQCRQHEGNWHAAHAEQLTAGQRVADAVAATMGSWTFIIAQ